MLIFLTSPNLDQMPMSSKKQDQYIWKSEVASLRVRTLTYSYGKNVVEGNGVCANKGCDEIEWPDKVIVGVIPANEWPCHVTSRKPTSSLAYYGS